jgi:hypothetical protein
MYKAERLGPKHVQELEQEDKVPDLPKQRLGT